MTEQRGISVFVVVRRKGDGYHEYQPDLVAAYLDSELAERHADTDPALDVEQVPLAPQVFIPSMWEQQPWEIEVDG